MVRAPLRTVRGRFAGFEERPLSVVIRPNDDTVLVRYRVSELYRVETGANDSLRAEELIAIHRQGWLPERRRVTVRTERGDARFTVDQADFVVRMHGARETTVPYRIIAAVAVDAAIIYLIARNVVTHMSLFSFSAI